MILIYSIEITIDLKSVVIFLYFFRFILTKKTQWYII